MAILRRAGRLLWRGTGWAGRSLLRRWRRSLQFRTVLVTVLLASVALVGVGAYLSSQIANSLFQERLRQAETDTRDSVLNVQNTFDGAQVTDRASVQKLVTDTLDALQSKDSELQRRYIFLAVPDQTQPRSRWVDSRSSPDTGITILPDDLRSAVQKGSREQYWESIALPVGSETDPAIVIGNKVSFNGTAYELYLIYDIVSAEQSLNDIQNVLRIGAAVLVVLIGVLAWYVTNTVVRPISHAAHVSENLAAGQLQERMLVKGEDEVARLGASFNHMAASLQEQITQLNTLSQMQQRFVSDVSHELRTPLTTVRMAADVLYDARDDFDAINKRSAELLHTQVERFQSLLSDLLEISRYDAGAARLDPEPLDLVALMGKVIDDAAPVAEEYGSPVHLTALRPDVVVEMDGKRIERILRNLLLNALEHGESRRVDVTVAANAGAAAVTVRDYGLGLEPSQAARVFDRFWRADPARARSTGGSGLGLSIAMEDTKLHRGWLEARGRKGEGSTFRLTLPLKAGEEIVEAPLPVENYQPTAPTAVPALPQAPFSPALPVPPFGTGAGDQGSAS
ncbi:MULTISPECIES: MtrAB system histidine kinase MtrB [Arthrobacter]|uniref:Sensor histidine kinase MtrB n=2 Tax=Arthrobacter TaxID=1663 RepID=A0ABU9KJQ6_9MICC|nr:MtrAB system histidine kinase MtrB [Arthrobacter sp. YJM1]MDP5227214.1 MtrAB system histidine kinase MtrB [Arthrobacter sp. YJM1]